MLTKNGFPKSSKAGDRWAEEANKERDSDYQPIWSFDCNYKLDFDGPLLNVTSRFRWYTGDDGFDKYGGDIEVYFGPLDGELLIRKELVAGSLPELKAMVAAFENDLKGRITIAVSSIVK